MANTISSALRKLFDTFFASMSDSLKLTYEESRKEKKSYIRVSVIFNKFINNREINDFISKVSQFSKYEVQYIKTKDNKVELFFGFDVLNSNQEKDIEFIRAHASKVEKTYWGKKYIIANINHSLVEDIFNIFNASKCQNISISRPDYAVINIMNINEMPLRFEMFLTDKKEANQIIDKMNKLRKNSKEIICSVSAHHNYDFACKYCEKSGQNTGLCNCKHENCKKWRRDINTWEVNITMVPDSFTHAMQIVGKNYKYHKKDIQDFTERDYGNLWIHKK